MTRELEIIGAGRFVVRRELGSGGMGVVFEVLDRQRREVMALKALRRLEPGALLRFKTEFRALADLHHENLVRLGELFADAGRWYFTMELVRGRDFLAWVREQPATASVGDVTAEVAAAGEVTRQAAAPPTNFERLRAALAQLARGLAALHAAGKVHRDVKPPNVLVTDEGRVVLLDFGLVADAEVARGDSDTNVVGTVAYMSPEQAASRRVGPAADWYAVGAILYEALTGAPPFTGPPLAVLVDKQGSEPPPPSARATGVPEDLDRLCVELLRTDPATRLAGEAALARLARAEPAGRASTPPPVPSVSLHAPFVGRVDELARLHAAWAEARDGQPRAVTVLLSGESGIGKSALARRFLAELGERPPGPLVLASRCYEREAVPFKGFDGLVDELSRHLSRLDQVQAALLLPEDAAAIARLFPVLRRVPAMARVADVRVGSPQELRSRAFSALRELLARIASRRPTVLFIDDFQWADDDSLALLEQIMHGASAPPVLLLVTGRPGTMLPRVAGLSRTLALAGLDGESARGLVSLLAGGGAGIDDRSIAAEAEGHPLFLQELVRHAQSGGPAGRVRLDEALLARAGALEPATRTLLEVLAVAGEPLALAVAADAARLPLAEAHTRLGMLRAAHLSRAAGHDGERAECYHDRVREAVAAQLEPGRERRLHLALAAALEAAGAGAASPHSLVRHFEAAGETARAARHAELAAERAAEALAFDLAADLYRTALRLGQPAEPQRRALMIALGDALVNAGRGAEAASVFQEAATGADPATRLECRRKAAQHLLYSGNLDAGQRAIADVLAELGERLPASPRRALASFLWGRARLRLRGFGFQPRHASEVSASALHRVDVYQAVAVGLGLVDTIRGADFHVRGLRAALQVGEITRVGRALGLDAAYLASQGSSARVRARRRLGSFKALAAGSNDAFLRAWSASADGTVAFLLGDFAPSLPPLHEAERIFRDETTGFPWELTTIRLFIMLALRHSGRFVELRRRYETHVPEARRRGDRYGETSFARIGCKALLAAGALDEIDEALAGCSWEAPPGSYHVQSFYEWMIRVECALYAGEARELHARSHEIIDAIKRSLLWRVQTIRTEAMWLAGQLALVAVPGREGEQRADAWARRLRREQVDYAEGWGELLGAAVARRRGDDDGARQALGRGIELLGRAGMPIAAACAELALAGLEAGTAGEARGARATGTLAAEGVARVERFTRTVVAGFDSA